MLPAAPRLTRYVFGGTAFLVASAGFFSPLVTTPLLVAGGLALLYDAISKRRWPVLPGLVGWSGAALVAWGLATALWAFNATPIPVKALELSVIAGLAFLWLDASMRIEARDAESMKRGLIAASFVAGSLLLIEVATAGGIHRFIFAQIYGAEALMAIEILNRPLTLFALTLWPSLLLLARRGRWSIVAALAVLGVVTVGGLHGGSIRVALVLGVLAAVATYFSPRRVPKIFGAAAAAFFLAAPVIIGQIATPDRIFRVFQHVPPTAAHRFEIWEFVASRVVERPFLGWGLNASRVLPGADAPYRGVGGPLMSLHPHNAALQIWVELGLPGALLAAVLVWAAFAAVGRLKADRTSVAAGVGLITTALTVANLSFGIWQTWWLAAMILATALFLAAVRYPAAESDR